MITIITGPRESGKSNYLQQWYNREKKGFGIISLKYYTGGRLSGYDLLLIPSMIIRPLCGIASKAPFNLRHHRFFFDPRAFKECEQMIKSWMSRNEGPCWIDEIGDLELMQNGFYSLLNHLIDKDADIRAVFREKYLEELIAHFNIEQYKLVQL